MQEEINTQAAIVAENRNNSSIKKTRGQLVAAAALTPALNAAHVVETYQNGVLGTGVDFMALIDGLKESAATVKADDLSDLEGMLVGQAKALETLFASLASRAAAQSNILHYQTFLGLALKAQSQSRATILALVDLKYPRQATFVKQANIAHGPQQVNNGPQEVKSAKAIDVARAEEIPFEQNELLEVRSHGSTQLDARAEATTKRGDTEVAAMAGVDRSANPAR